MSIIRINNFESREGKAEELYKFLESIIPYIKSSNGCIDCNLLTEHENPNSFVVLEKWESIEDHKRSIENFPKEEMGKAMELLGSPPKGVYYKS